MIYIYDLVLNWSNKGRYEFFEWNSSDEVEYIKKIPVFRIENFYDIVNYNFQVDKDFLNKILNKTEVYNNKEVNKVEYCCIFCNKNLTNAIACEFGDDGIVLYSSNIYFLDLDDVLDLGKKIKSFYLDGKNVEKKYNCDSCDLYLTRKEKAKKKMLLENIDIAYKNKDLYKLKYLYYELFNKDCDDIDKIKYSLDNSINNLYTNRHDELYKIIYL